MIKSIITAPTKIIPKNTHKTIKAEFPFFPSGSTGSSLGLTGSSLGLTG